MKKSKKLATALTSVAMVAVVVGSVFTVRYFKHPKRQFPMWQTPCFELPMMNETINGMRFTGIDFEATTIGNEVYDDVIVLVDTPPGEGFVYAPLQWVDYFYDGEWHTIWCNNQAMLSTFIVDGKEGVEEHEMKFHVQSGLFVRDGRYRLCVDNSGFCDIDIIGAENMK